MVKSPLGGSSLPLSFAQQRLWFLNQWEPESSAYHLPFAWRLRGSLNQSALEASLHDLLVRHESLRTTFTIIDGQPAQVIAPVSHVPLPVVDLREFAEPDREAEVTRLIQETASQPFDFTTGPLWRTTLLHLNADEHIFLVTLHHIITDGWSMGIFWRELTALYAANLNGKPSELPPLPIQYADYAVWQREWIQDDVLAEQLQYWHAQLADAPPSLDLPADAPRPPHQSYQGMRKSFSVTPSLTKKLKRLSQKEGVTLFMTLLAAFQILLWRYTGQRDVLVGSPTAGRTRTELEGLLGFFVNTLVLRTRFKGQPTFREVLRQVRETCFAALKYQDLPFEKLVEVLQPVRDPSRHPIFQVMFQLYQGEPISSLTLSNLQVELIQRSTSTAKFDLELSLVDNLETLKGNVTFNTDLFSDSTIARFIMHYQTLLEGLVADTEQAVTQVLFLTDAEQHQLSMEWNPPISQAESGICIHDLFEAQVARTPEAIALVFEEHALTYAELNTRANQLAHYLRSRGVGPEVLVGLFLDRSLDMVIGVLGIFKAGGAYVPLNPTYPEERLAFMLKDGHLSLLMTQKPFLTRLPHHGAQVVCLDIEGELITKENQENPANRMTSENLAYVMYTSGSTGMPKGVQISHQAVVNLLTAMRQEPGLTDRDILLSVTTLSFDISALELFLPLIVGARVILANRDVALDGAQLGEMLTRSATTVMQATPTTWRLLLAADWRGSTQLKILCGGEALPRELANQLQPKCAVLWNMYGPTETTIWSAVCQVEVGAGSVPLGRPIANTKFYILDAQRNPVPIGVHGELNIGGVGLARGYLNRPDLSAEKFTPDPFSERPGTRIYKSGDLARRYGSDWVIEFLGRIDHQVKLRGYRIELGEIEAVLAQHPTVQDAVVLCREDTPGDKQLVAYVVRVPETHPDPSTLRSYLKTQLPEHMHPHVFLILESLPLTSSGKINRSALPAPDPIFRTLNTKYIPPRTPVEELIADIWRELLKVERIGVHDNFFELGGHSLLATKVAARIQALLQTELSVRTLFDCPTIGELADALHVTSSTTPSFPSCPLRPQSREEALPLSFAQQRLWFLDQWEPGSSAYHLPHAWRLRGPLNPIALEAALQDLVARHESLRTSFPSVGGQPVQVIASDSSVPLPVVELREFTEPTCETEVMQLIQETAARPFDLSTGPLWRTTLLRLEEDHHILLVTLHHIITDGWSMEIFWRELTALYTAHVNGNPPSLPPVPIQYGDYAVWQRQRLHGEVLEQHLTYWRTQLADAPPHLSLPTDLPRPPQQSYRGAKKPFPYPPGLPMP